MTSAASAYQWTKTVDHSTMMAQVSTTGVRLSPERKPTKQDKMSARTNQIRFSIPQAQYDKVEDIMHIYGHESVNTLARYFFEKGLEIASTKCDLHSQVDLMTKMLDAAHNEFVTKEAAQDIMQKQIEVAEQIEQQTEIALKN